jgi:nicotinamidase-related amidase
MDISNSVLVVIDIQERLLPSIADNERLLASLDKLISGCTLLGLPIIWTEQLPHKLGPTVTELAELMPGIVPITKSAFGCADSEEFVRVLNETGCSHVLLCGIEAHICVYQTSAQLLKAGYEVSVITDAIGSRNDSNLNLAIRCMENNGASLSGVEMALFELQKIAEGESFRQLLKIVK